MSFEELIYADGNDKLDASVAAGGYTNKELQNRVYINTLGAKLAMKYLASENIDISNVHNIHSIKKILEEIDIADVMLSNVHIDVRVVFDENIIFIPKSHFKFALTPDIYLVMYMAKDASFMKLLGFFEPKMINKNNQNNDYYFIEKEKLNPVVDLKNFINGFEKHAASISDNELENSERIIMAMTDNDISDNDKKYLLKQLTLSAELRDKFIEFENFENLSYKAMSDTLIWKKDINDVESIHTDSEEAIENEINNEPEENSNEEDINFEEIDNLSSENILADEIVLPESFDTDMTESLITEDILPENSEIDMSESFVTEDKENDDEEAISETLLETSITDEIPEMLNIDLLENEINIEPEVNELNEEEFLNIYEVSGEVISDSDNEMPDALEDNLSENLSLENIVEPVSVEKDLSLDLPELSIENLDISVEGATNNEELLDDALNLDAIEDIEEKTDLSEFEPDVMPLDDIIAVDDISQNDIIDNVPQEDIFHEDFSKDKIPQDDIIDDVSFDDLTENLTDAEIQTLQDIEDYNAVDSDFVNENDESSYAAEGFGTNLLNGLMEEGQDKEISDEIIHDITNAEDISSTDLLAEIDNILENSSNAGNSELSDVVPDEYTEFTDDIDLEIDSIISSAAQDETNSDNNNDNLEVLFNDTEAENVVNNPSMSSMADNSEETADEEIQIPGAALYNKSQAGGKKAVLAAAVLTAVLAAGGAFMFFKPKDENVSSIEPLNQKNEIIGEETKTPPIETNVPEIVNNNEQPKVKSTQPVKELKNNPMKIPSTSYLQVNRLVWDVPDSLSYSPKIQNYLNTAGKSIKLSLSADLLLATEYPYSNKIKVNVKISKDGSLQSAIIAASSGSIQIDKIVLQSVKETLNVVKPPVSEIKTPDFNLSLIIYI